MPAPRCEWNWHYVWPEREPAEAFCRALNRDVLSKSWQVQELPEDAPVSHGPLRPVRIELRRHSLGAGFSLHPHSKNAILKRFPSARRLSNLQVDYSTYEEADQFQEALWNHIVPLLTGLSVDELVELGGFIPDDIPTHQVAYHPSPARVESQS